MKFTVVGGGTAGWMTAATLNKAYPDSTIIVYESPDTPATGVGESTTQFFRYWLNYIGLQDEDWMKELKNSAFIEISLFKEPKKDSSSDLFESKKNKEDESGLKTTNKGRKRKRGKLADSAQKKKMQDMWEKMYKSIEKSKNRDPKPSQN